MTPQKISNEDALRYYTNTIIPLVNALDEALVQSVRIFVISDLRDKHIALAAAGFASRLHHIAALHTMTHRRLARPDFDIVELLDDVDDLVKALKGIYVKAAEGVLAIPPIGLSSAQLKRIFK